MDESTPTAAGKLPTSAQPSKEGKKDRKTHLPLKGGKHRELQYEHMYRPGQNCVLVVLWPAGMARYVLTD